MSHIPVSRALQAMGINGYSTEGAERKEAFHREGKKFLTAMAKRLGYTKADYDLRSNLAGIAVSGEVTLHSDQLYLQLSESFTAPGVHMLYRACRGRRDCTGLQNHFVNMRDLSSPETQNRVLENMLEMAAKIQSPAQVA